MEELLLHRLREVEFLRELPEGSLRSVSDDATVMPCRHGDIVFGQGDASDAAFAVLDGAVEISVHLDGGATHAISEMGPGMLFGEIGLLTGEARNATARIKGDALILRFPSAAFLQLLAADDGIAERVVEAAAERLNRTQLTAQLVQHFGADVLGAVEDIEPLTKWRYLRSGECLFRIGDRADAVYLIASGRVRALDAHGDVVGEAGRGELVGEMALVEQGVRAAAVYAVRDTRLVELSAAALDVLLDRYPRAFFHLTKTIVHQVRVPASRRRSETQVTIALVPLVADVDVHGFAVALESGLEQLGSAVHLWPDRVDTLLNRWGVARTERDALAELQVSQLLHEQEDRSNFLLLETGCDRSPWSERVMRQCDHVLFVANADAAPRRAEVDKVLEKLPDRLRPRSTLALLHDSTASLPSQTGRWLTGVGVQEVLHVRRGAHSDMQRVARVVGRRGVSVVLSGGGARGFAHIGALKAMKELGIAIDYIAGTSIGAVISGFAALGYTADDIAGLVQESFDSIMDWTLPVVSVISGKRIARAIEKQTRGAQIEDLWLPYFCVSASLTSARPVVHRRGALDVALRASVAVPGLLPPLPFGDELLVDGGIIDNLPIEEARNDNRSGTLIAVDVSPTGGLAACSDYGSSISGWQAFGAAVRKRQRPPLLYETVLGSMLLASTRDRDRVVATGLADLYLPIDARQCGPFEWTAVEKISKVGYETALGPLAEWSGQHEQSTSRTARPARAAGQSFRE